MGLRDIVTGAVAAAAVTAGTVGIDLHGIEAETGIPAVAVDAYVRAAAGSACGVDWRDLAAIGMTETGHGRSQGGHLADDGTDTVRIVSSAGALGPLQFLPDTWSAYAADGNGDGVADIDNVYDAAVASADYLCSNGYAPDVDSRRNSLGAYNGGALWARYAESRAYVELATSYAAGLPALEMVRSSQTSADVIDGPAPVPATAPLAPPELPTLGSRAEAAWRAAIKRWDALGAAVARPDTPMLHATWSAADRTVTGRTGGTSP